MGTKKATMPSQSSTNEIAKKLFSENASKDKKGNASKDKKVSRSESSTKGLAKKLFKQREEQSKILEEIKANSSEEVLPDNFYEDRTTPGIKLKIFDVNTENYHLGACTVICLLLKHFGIEDIDPEKLQQTDLLIHLANLDEKILANLNVNIPGHFNELGTLTNPEILATPNSPKELSVQNVIDYVWNAVDDPYSSYVQERSNDSE